MSDVETRDLAEEPAVDGGAANPDVVDAEASHEEAPEDAPGEAPKAAVAGDAGEEAVENEVDPLLRLSTACGPLDALLDGGLETDAITLVFGEGGSGKTNLALQCAREAASRGRRVAYVDTEGVSADRLTQIFASSPDPEKAQERLLFYTPFDIQEQERLVRNATMAPDLGLLVVDSINMHYRLHIDGGGDVEKEAARSLFKQLHHLTNFARQKRVPVLVTGQVYGFEDTTQPFARRVMEHLVKGLIRFEKRPDGSRRATVLKHRSIEDGRQARFRIGRSGLEKR